MTEPIVFDLAAAQEYGRFLEEAERAERARWLDRQCGGCVDGGTGELCEEHWIASATEAELAAIDANGGPGDLFDPQEVSR